MAELAYWFHVRPWETDRLTVDDLRQLCSVLDKSRRAGERDTGNQLRHSGRK